MKRNVKLYRTDNILCKHIFVVLILETFTMLWITISVGVEVLTTYSSHTYKKTKILAIKNNHT